MATHDAFERAVAAPPSDGPSGPRAGFWARFGAIVTDGILFAVVDELLHVVLGDPGEYLAVVLAAAYFVYLEGGPAGQTLGKRVFGIRVVSFATGGPLGYTRALVRYVGRIASFFAFLVGYLWMLGDRERQCWHDKLAGDVVVPTSFYPVGR